MNDWMNDDYVKQIVLDKNTHESGIFNKDEIQKLFSKSNLNDPYDFNGKNLDDNECSTLDEKLFLIYASYNFKRW